MSVFCAWNFFVTKVCLGLAGASVSLFVSFLVQERILKKCNVKCQHIFHSCSCLFQSGACFRNFTQTCEVSVPGKTTFRKRSVFVRFQGGFPGNSGETYIFAQKRSVDA